MRDRSYRVFFTFFFDPPNSVEMAPNGTLILGGFEPLSGVRKKGKKKPV